MALLEKQALSKREDEISRGLYKSGIQTMKSMNDKCALEGGNDRRRKL